MNEDFSFAVEYAKSGRAFCKKCKENIAKNSLRLAIMVQSSIYDKKMPMWYHLSCFFQEKTVLKSVDEISNFPNLRWDDKEKIKKYLTDINISEKQSNGNSDISVVYIKSISSSKVCGETIKKGCANVSKLPKDVEFAQYDPRPLWYNEDCFAEKKCEINYKDSDNKKRKAENEGKPVNEIKKKALTREDRQLKVQSEMLLKMRDDLKNNLNEKQMLKLLEYNCQHIIIGHQRLLEHLSDCMVFGALKECPECKSDRPYYLGSTYKCEGNLTEWTYCQYETRFPDREEFKIPPELKDIVFLQNYKSKVQERKFPKGSDSEKIKKKLPLDDYKVFILGKFAVSDENMAKEIDELGGSISIDLDLSVDFCISTAAEVESKSDKIQQLEKLNIHVISYAFLEEVKKGSPVAYSMKQALLCPWGGDPIIKFGIKQEHGSKKKVNEEESLKSVSLKVKVTAEGPSVDPESGLEASCHVFQIKKDFYNAVLVMVDMGKGTNSFYKLQMLESNKGSKSKYFVFSQWGTVGRPVDGKRIQSFSNKKVAMNSFENIFLEKTGNEWINRHSFVKKPGLMYPIEIDYGKETEKVKELKPCDDSKLPKPIQELICLIFNIESMRTAMLEFEIDLTKMPLGKLSKKQIEQAYKVLGEAQQVLITGCNKNKILDVSNRFYSLIPHDFGLKASPLLDHEEIVKTKIEMLESLLEIEIAYSLLHSESSSSIKSPVDENYEKLKTDIEVLPKNSEEYKDIQTYMQNTNNNCRGLKLQEVFRINRHGENVRYQSYKHLHNKMLLWHGSRLTNFVGILSQGLRIAPPEAPPTGYMFGKGIYFADMVSKSANYCFMNRSNPTGFILLCEVALGNMYQCKTAKNINKLPKDKHSTMGMGRTIPDPSKSIKKGDVEIPCGKPIQSGVQGSLNYNEYIIYDIKQVHIKYLLKVCIK